MTTASGNGFWSAVNVARWIGTDASPEECAFVQGAAFQMLAIHARKTEAELYADFAARAATDPDCNVLRT